MITDGEAMLTSLKHLAWVEMGQSPSSKSYRYDAKKGVPFLQGTADFGVEYPIPRVFSNDANKFAGKGDILVSVRAPVGSLNIADQIYGIGRGLCAVRCEEQLDSRFAWWALHWATAQLALEATGSTYDAVAAEDVANLLLPTYQLLEQKSIADYLDRETDKIDALTKSMQRLLTALAEKRQAVITHAATRGLNPDAPLRDSGVAWIGEIPAHWTIKRAKHLGTIGNGSTPLRQKEEYWKNGSFPWLTSTVVNDNIVPPASQFVTEKALVECHLPIVQPNSVLVAITGQGKTRGKASLLKYQATINQHMAFIEPDMGQLNPQYLQLYLSSMYQNLRMISEGAGSTRGALTIEQIAEFPVVLPDIDEQNTIVANTELTLLRIDDLSTAVRKMKEILQERRTSLISAAVTGQIQVTA